MPPHAPSKPLRRLAPSYPASASDSGADCPVRLSTIIAVGWGLRPANWRSSERTSSSITQRHRPAPSAASADRPLPMAADAGHETPRVAGAHDIAKAVNTARNACSRCGAISRHRVRYGATNAHSPSLISLGYLVRYCFSISPCPDFAAAARYLDDQYSCVAVRA